MIKAGTKQILVGISLALFLTVILGTIKYLQIAKAIKDHSSFQPPPETVNVIRVAKGSWGTNVKVSGDVVPVQGVTLSNEVAGTVVGIGFESGTTVKTGDLLIELNATEEMAELRAAEAIRERARTNLARITALTKQSASSRDDLESAQSQLIIAQAKVDAINAQIKKKRIVAPFDGLVGVRQVNLGQYISPGTQIVSIHSVDQLRINFRLPQHFFNGVHNGQKIRVALPSNPDLASSSQAMTDSSEDASSKDDSSKDDSSKDDDSKDDDSKDGASKDDATNTTYQQVISAKITAKEPAIDPTNRNFLVQATVDSVTSEETDISSLLRAGMFVDVEIELDDRRPVLIAPVSSIAHASYGDSVFVVNRIHGAATAVVKQQMVTLGNRRGEMVAVVAGLKGDEEIVSSGVFKLRPNTQVVVSQEPLPDTKVNGRLPDA